MVKNKIHFASIIIILSIFLAFFNHGCKKDLVISSEIEGKNAINVNYWVADGVLHFSGVDVYFSLLDSLLKLDYNEFRKWENSIGFSSFWTEQQTVLDYVENISNKNDFYMIAAAYPNLVYLDRNELELVDIGSNYKLVSNSDGIFCINNMYHKVSQDEVKVTQAEDLKSALINFNTNKDVIGHQIQEEIVKTRAEGCGTDYIYDEKSINSSYWNGYRKVEAWLRIRIDYIVYNPCCVVYQQYVDMQIAGKKMNIWGQIYTYETIHHWSHLEVVFDRLTKSGTYTCTNIKGCTSSSCDRVIGERGYTVQVPDGSSPEQRIYSLRIYSGPQIYNNPISLNTKFDKASLKAWTRGTGSDNYAAICCNYANCDF